MFMERKRKINIRLIIISKIHLCFSFSFIFLVFLICTVLSTACLDTGRCIPMFAKADRDFQKFEEGIGQDMMHEERTEGFSLRWARRILGGPGSSPPRCTSKCGNCTPCRPVHVPVPPGTPVTAEYYPEAWRCKCGNRLYMP